MGEVIAQEAAALGVNNLFAPVVDLARELRFGRVEEMYSEDAYLSGEMGHAYVVGLQKTKKVAAMVKHFAAFGTPEQGLNTAPVHGGERELRRTYVVYALHILFRVLTSVYFFLILDIFLPSSGVLLMPMHGVS